MFDVIVGFAYLAVFIAVAVAELLFAARSAASSDSRLVTNFGFGILNFTVLSALPIGLAAAASYADAHRIGLFNRIDLPQWLAFATSLVCFSLLQYVAHRLFHSVPLLWRFHQIHHADRSMDASTALRTHPFEHLVLLTLLSPTTLALGTPVWAVFTIGILSFTGAVFTHGDVRMAPAWSRWISRIFMTPDLHAVHHSAVRAEHDSNYGDMFTLWDRLFGSYRACPVERLGLGEASDAQADNLIAQLRGPFVRAQSVPPPVGDRTPA